MTIAQSGHRASTGALLMSSAEAPEHLQPFWEDFFAGLADGFTEIATAWQQKDLIALAKYAHSYKGQVMFFQYGGFYQRFEALELCLSKRNPPCIEQIIAELQQYFQQEVQRYEAYKNCHR